MTPPRDPWRSRDNSLPARLADFWRWAYGDWWGTTCIVCGLLVFAAFWAAAGLLR